MPEISQAQLDVLTRAKAVLDKVWDDKSVGLAVKRSAKELYPDANIPQIDIIEPALEPFRAQLTAAEERADKLSKQLEAWEQKAKDADDSASMKTLLDAARSKFNLTDEGVSMMVEHMKTTGNYTDAMGAAAFVASQAPKPSQQTSPGWAPQAADLFGSQKRDEQFESLHRDPRGYLDEQLRMFVNDPNGYVTDTLGA